MGVRVGFLIPALGRQILDDSWGSLTRQSGLIGEPLDTVRY